MFSVGKGGDPKLEISQINGTTLPNADGMIRSRPFYYYILGVLATSTSSALHCRASTLARGKASFAMAITRSRSRPVTPGPVISTMSPTFSSPLSKPKTTALRAAKSDVVPVTPSPTKSRKRKQSPTPTTSSLLKLLPVSSGQDS